MQELFNRCIPFAKEQYNTTAIAYILIMKQFTHKSNHLPALRNLLTRLDEFMSRATTNPPDAGKKGYH